MTRVSIVVFPGGDVSAATRGVHLERRLVIRLPSGPRQSDEIARNQAATVNAHGMRRVTAQRGDRLLVVPEADCFEERVDGPCGRFPRLGIAHEAATAKLRLAVAADPPAIRRHAIDACLAQSQMSDGLSGF